MFLGEGRGGGGGGVVGDLNLLSAHRHCGSYLDQQTDVQYQHGIVQAARSDHRWFILET